MWKINYDIKSGTSEVGLGDMTGLIYQLSASKRTNEWGTECCVAFFEQLNDLLFW